MKIKDAFLYSPFLVIPMTIISLPFVVSYCSYIWLRRSLIEIVLGLRDGVGDLIKIVKQENP